MSDELKLCPFCGQQHKIENGMDFHYGINHEIVCNRRVIMSSYSLAEKIGIVTQWNTRPIEDGLRVELAQERQLTDAYLDKIAHRDTELAAMTAELDGERAGLIYTLEMNKTLSNDLGSMCADLAAMTARCEKAEAVCKALDTSLLRWDDDDNVLATLKAWAEASKP